MRDIQLDRIQVRKREIADEINRLQKEAEELDIAERVFNRLSRPPGKKPPVTPRQHKRQAKLGPARPADLPSNFEMVNMILKSSEREGTDGITANEIVEQMGKRYWPGVKGPQVLSFIYKFAKAQNSKRKI